MTSHPSLRKVIFSLLAKTVPVMKPEKQDCAGLRPRNRANWILSKTSLLQGMPKKRSNENFSAPKVSAIPCCSETGSFFQVNRGMLRNKLSNFFATLPGEADRSKRCGLDRFGVSIRLSYSGGGSGAKPNPLLGCLGPHPQSKHLEWASHSKLISQSVRASTMHFLFWASVQTKMPFPVAKIHHPLQTTAKKKTVDPTTNPTASEI